MIEPSELAEDLLHCLKLAPYNIPSSIINRQIDQLRQGNLNTDAALSETHALADLVERYLRFFKQDRVDALMACEVYVVPLPLCVAYSKPKKTGNLIIVGSGLLDLICTCGYWGQFSESLPESMGDIFPMKQFPSTSLRDAVPVFLYTLLYRFYKYGEPLPDLTCLVPESMQPRVKDALAGAMSFILFHELGHLELKHLENETIRPMNEALLIEEHLTLYQRQELEADEFALKSIQKDYRKLHSAWVNMALNFHIQAETMLSHRTHEHPISLNRLGYANISSEGHLMDPETYLAHLDSMVRAQSSLEKKNQQLKSSNKKPFLELFSRTEVLEHLDRLNRLLEAEGYDMGEALQNKPPNWAKAVGLQ